MQVGFGVFLQGIQSETVFLHVLKIGPAENGHKGFLCPNQVRFYCLREFIRVLFAQAFSQGEKVV